MLDVSSQDIAKFQAESEATARATVQQLQRMADGNQHLLGKQAAAGSYTISAQANFAQAFIYGTMQITNAHYQGYTLGFEAKMWGLGIGGGTSAGALTLTVPPEKLNKLKCSFQATFAAAAISVQIWDEHHGYVANFTGAALAVAAGVTGGHGTWSAHK